MENVSHEAFIDSVRALATMRVNERDQTKLNRAKVVYGLGGGYRGVTYYGGWDNGDDHPDGRDAFVELAATGEENDIQLAGTTIHELAHVLAGSTHGHDKEWKACAEVMGLRNVLAAGQVYTAESFAPELWEQIGALASPTDGKPVFLQSQGPVPLPGKMRPCPMGTGTRGGKSRGKGSGSRLRKWLCSCGVIARVASDEFAATCDKCRTPFKRG